jgi:hypothetical protein
MSSREERIGLNEVVFREVNERIENLAETFDLKTQALDLVCECGDGTCEERLTMTRAEYEEVLPTRISLSSIPAMSIRTSRASSPG